jgi:hypothetical protein
MRTRHSHKERRFPNSDKSNSVMNQNGPKSKFHCGLLSNLPQLVLGHFPVRFVIDSFDFAPILGATNNPSKINCRACSGIHSILWRFELRFYH